MSVDRHKAILNAMLQSAFYPHRVEAISCRETHISSVVLTGDYVYKIKKAVNLGFLDFTTLAQREHYCRQEVLLNRRLSGDVYLDTIPITLKDGRYALDGAGETVEFAVRMRQLDDADGMLPRLQRGTLTDADIADLIDRLIAFYAAPPPVTKPEAVEQPAWEENLQRMEGFAGTAIDRQRFNFVRSASEAYHRRHGDLFLKRRLGGRIRDGHGDLRLDHIYFTRDGIQVIDCIEFNDRLRILDIISDLAFLAMDLEYHHFPHQARLVVRRYVERTGDVGSLPLLDFYRCYRAMVRCKVNCFLLREIGVSGPRRQMLQTAADGYLALAGEYAAAFSRPRLWIACGMPAAGKSTIAAALATVHGCRVLRSDVVRKQLFTGADGSDAQAGFETGLYSAYATEVTYRQLFTLAQEELKKGRSVVIDATFSRNVQRREILRIADLRQVTPIFVECRAAEAVLAERLRRRETEPSISDARLIHLEAFKQRFAAMEGLAPAIHITVDTENPPERCLRRILLSDVLWNDRPSGDPAR